MAELLAQSKADVGFTFQGFSQDHFGASFFPTKFGHIHRNLDGRDHFAMYQTAVKAAGAKMFAYYSYQDRSVWDRYPDWRIRSANGETLLQDNFGYLCPNSPYRDYIILRLAEITEKYRPDGWLLDMIQGHICYCDYCRRKYRMTFGYDLPSGDPDAGADWQRHKRWRYDDLVGFYREIVTVIKNITTDAVMTHNAFMLWNYDEWRTGEDHEALMAFDEVVTNIYASDHGASDGIARSPDMIWKAGYNTRVFRGLSDKPVWMQFGRFMYTRDYSAIPEHELSKNICGPRRRVDFIRQDRSNTNTRTGVEGLAAIRCYGNSLQRHAQL